LSAENLLVKILQRAKELADKNIELFSTPALRFFLYEKYSKKDFTQKAEVLETFADLDDNDIMSAVKVWAKHKDVVLSELCKNLVNRHLYRIELQREPFKEEQIKSLKEKVKKKFKINESESEYFVFSGAVTNDTYRADKIRINILFKDGTVADIADASDQMNLDVLSRTIKKHYLCYPKEII